jgi:acyl-CoA synthetase (AMP-forming)/AMP-acid ligase II
MRQFDPETTASLIRQHQIEVLVGSPFIFEALARTGSGSFRSVHTALSSGAPLPPRVEQDCFRHLGLRVRQLYGSTETGTIAIQSQRDDQAAGSMGSPLPRVEIRILGPDLLPLPEGESGEISVKSPALMSGYWENGAASRSGFHGDFFRTGDLGFLTAGGELVLQGRAKPMINVGGIKVDPEEIAMVIRKIPGVLSCKVYGVSHPAQTEIIAVSLQCDPERTVDRSQVVDHCRQHLSEHKIPRQIFFSRGTDDVLLGKSNRSQGADHANPPSPQVTPSTFPPDSGL